MWVGQSNLSNFRVIEADEPYELRFDEEPDLEDLMSSIDRKIDFDLEILEEDKLRVEDDNYPVPLEVELETEHVESGWRVRPRYQGSPVLAYNLGNQIDEMDSEYKRSDGNPTDPYRICHHH